MTAAILAWICSISVSVFPSLKGYQSLFGASVTAQTATHASPPPVRLPDIERQADSISKRR